MLKGDLARSADHLDRAFTDLRLDRQARVNLGVLRAAAGDSDRARLLFSGVLGDDPGSLPALYNLARLCVETKDFASARHYMDRFLSLTVRPTTWRERVLAWLEALPDK